MRRYQTFSRSYWLVRKRRSLRLFGATFTAPTLTTPSLKSVTAKGAVFLGPVDASFRQRQLFQVLKAYAAFNPDIGYCQGMGRLVGLMLMYMSAEETFWLLAVTLHDAMDAYYDQQLSRLSLDAALFDLLLTKHNEKVARVMVRRHRGPRRALTPVQRQCQIPAQMYLAGWLLPIYTMTLSWPSVLRVWDLLYCEGKPPPISQTLPLVKGPKCLFRVALGIVKCLQGERCFTKLGRILTHKVYRLAP